MTLETSQPTVWQLPALLCTSRASSLPAASVLVWFGLGCAILFRFVSDFVSFCVAVVHRV